MNRIRILFFLLSGYCLNVSLWAQAPTPMPTQVGIRVVSMEGLLTDLVIVTPSGRKRFVAKAKSFSKEIDAKVVEGKVLFYRHHQTSKPDEPNETKTDIAASFLVQPDVRHYLVILKANGRGDSRSYRVYAIPDDPERFSEGQARIINFTANQLAVRLGANREIIGPGQSAVMTYKPDTDGQVILQQAIPDSDKQWLLVSSTRETMPRDRRTLILIAPGELTSRQGQGTNVNGEADGGMLDMKILYD